jgi:hypothetical protein
LGYQNHMDQDKYPIQKLNRQEFTSALHKGLGRALLHVQQYRLDDVADIVLQACLHYPVFSMECEGGYSEWLFSMFNNTRFYPEFRQAILDALEDKTDKNLDELFILAKEMALSGDEHAKTVLRKQALALAHSDSIYDNKGALEWIEVGGMEALLELVRIYSQRLADNVDDDGVPTWEFGDNKTHQEFSNNLSTYIAKEPIFQHYSDHLKKIERPNSPPSHEEIEARKKRSLEDRKRRFNLERTLYDAKNKKMDYPGHYGTFGRYATKEELDIVNSILLNEPDDEIRLRLLWVFSRTPIPVLSEKLFLWAEGDNDKLRGASLRVLAQSTDKRIHQLAIKNMLAGKLSGPDSVTMELFINNYEKGDGKLISNVLASLIPATEDGYRISLSIVDIAKKHHDLELTNALKWAYESATGPLIRCLVIMELDAINQLNNDILNECLYDSDKEIRSFAEKKLAE